MIYVVCAIRDAKSDAFMRPMFFQTTGQAIRSFQDEVNRPGEGNMLNAHPEDFELFKISSWDDGSAMFTQDSRPVSLLTGSDAIRKSS